VVREEPGKRSENSAGARMELVVQVQGGGGERRLIVGKPGLQGRQSESGSNSRGKERDGGWLQGCDATGAVESRMELVVQVRCGGANPERVRFRGGTAT
jgi:hypothetical protein